MKLALPPNDPTLEQSVAFTFSMVPSMAKKIEPVGKYYARL